MPSNAAKIRKQKEARKKFLDSQEAIINKLKQADIKRASKALDKSDKQLNELAKRMVDAAKRLCDTSSESAESLVVSNNNQRAAATT